MMALLRWAAMIVLGLVVGVGVAAWQVRSSGLGGGVVNGPWTTGSAVGTAQASVRERAGVALRGLLALPRSEAMYFNASADSAGRPLSGKCTYRIAAQGPIAARWWSVTVYDPDGWLIVGPTDRHSLGSAQLAGGQGGQWSFTVAPEAVSGAWVPTGTEGPFDLTLRAYRPAPQLLDNPAGATLPVIERLECRP